MRCRQPSRSSPAAIAAGLEREGWRHRTDEGWSDYDVEVSGTRWSRLQLVTVMEHLPGGGRLHRVRLRPGWSMQALAAFWGLVAAELLIIGFGRRQFSWVWYLLLTLPLFAWYLDQEQKRVVRLLVGLLDEIAGSLRMHRVPVDAPPAIAKPAGDPRDDPADRRD